MPVFYLPKIVCAIRPEQRNTCTLGPATWHIEVDLNIYSFVSLYYQE